MKNHKIPFKYGLVTAIVLIVYFLFLGALHLNSNPAYSFVNAVICAVGISISIRSLRKHEGEGIDYYEGFKTGFLTGFYATIIFTIFFISYYSYSANFANELMLNIGLNVNTGLLFVGVAVMGLASSLVMTFALMQLYKKKMHISQHHHGDHKVME